MPGGTEKIAGLWFARGYQYPGWHCVTRSSHRRRSIQRVFLKISQNLQENACDRIFFLNKVGDLRAATLLKKRLWHRCFPVNFAKFLKTPFLQNFDFLTGSELLGLKRRLLTFYYRCWRSIDFRKGKITISIANKCSCKGPQVYKNIFLFAFIYN